MNLPQSMLGYCGELPEEHLRPDPLQMCQEALVSIGGEKRGRWNLGADWLNLV